MQISGVESWNFCPLPRAEVPNLATHCPSYRSGVRKAYMPPSQVGGQRCRPAAPPAAASAGHHS